MKIKLSDLKEILSSKKLDREKLDDFIKTSNAKINDLVDAGKTKINDLTDAGRTKINDLIEASKAKSAAKENTAVEVAEDEYADKKRSVIFVLAIVGAVATVAAIAYAVYRFATPKYLDDFDDDFDDDFFDDVNDEIEAIEDNEDKED